MSHTIEDLWNGNLAPCDQCGAHDGQINRLHVLIERHREGLCEMLTPEQRQTFDKYLDCMEEQLLLLMERAFCDGFSLASRLLTEALCGGE